MKLAILSLLVFCFLVKAHAVIYTDGVTEWSITHGNWAVSKLGPAANNWEETGTWTKLGAWTNAGNSQSGTANGIAINAEGFLTHWFGRPAKDPLVMLQVGAPDAPFPAPLTPNATEADAITDLSISLDLLGYDPASIISLSDNLGNVYHNGSIGDGNFDLRVLSSNPLLTSYTLTVDGVSTTVQANIPQLIGDRIEPVPQSMVGTIQRPVPTPSPTPFPIVPDTAPPVQANPPPALNIATPPSPPSAQPGSLPPSPTVSSVAPSAVASSTHVRPPVQDLETTRLAVAAGMLDAINEAPRRTVQAGSVEPLQTLGKIQTEAASVNAQMVQLRNAARSVAERSQKLFMAFIPNFTIPQTQNMSIVLANTTIVLDFTHPIVGIIKGLLAFFTITLTGLAIVRTFKNAK